MNVVFLLIFVFEVRSVELFNVSFSVKMCVVHIQGRFEWIIDFVG